MENVIRGILVPIANLPETTNLDTYFDLMLNELFLEDVKRICSHDKRLYELLEDYMYRTR